MDVTKYSFSIVGQSRTFSPRLRRADRTPPVIVQRYRTGSL